MKHWFYELSIQDVLNLCVQGMPTTARVRDLIRAIRACKTAQDERDLINKECAYIRTSFKGEDNDARARDVAKVLYIHMMGYPSHFGQVR